MGKIKDSICKFINTKIFPDSIRQLRDECYYQEKHRVEAEFKKLEASYNRLKCEYNALANHQFEKAINVDLEKSLEKQKEKIVENNNSRDEERENPFDTWR